MTGDVVLELRHRPIQERGIKRFEAILNAGRQVLAHGGYEHFTVEDVAAAAGVPVGSVYQYFPNKYAIVAELAAQDSQLLVRALAEAAPNFPTDQWQQVTDDLIEVLAHLWADHPWRPAVYAAMRSTAVTRRRAQEHTAAIAMAATAPLTPLTDQLSDEQRYAVALVLVESCETLLNLAVQDGTLNETVVVEMKRMVRAYLRSIALVAN